MFQTIDIRLFVATKKGIGQAIMVKLDKEKAGT